MPRTGGESGKLGDRYEAIWTVDSLLDVLRGEASWLVVEPFDRTESLGIEFKKAISANVEFHSAKRQTTGLLWSLADLTRSDNGRSVLGDLLQKLALDPQYHVVFVSGTTAKDLEEICVWAADSKDVAAFSSRMDTCARALRIDFEDRILKPQFGSDMHIAWEALRRIRVVGWNEREMIRRVEQRIRDTLYHTEGARVNAEVIRVLLAEVIPSSFGQKITRKEISDFLAKHQIAERDWTREQGPREVIEKRNAAYVGNVEAELIAGERITREEATKATDALIRGDKKRAVIVGAAGMGKSCTTAQTLVKLRESGIPAFAIRLDIQTEVLTSRRLGEELGLPESPAVVLAGIADGGCCVLIIDQLDAISFASGRSQTLWQVFEEMLKEAQSYPQMRVLLACRAFDAEHDPRIRRLLADKDSTLRIDLEKLSNEAVREVIRKHVGDPAELDSAHIGLLRTPLHLNLYLQSDPKLHPMFSGAQDLLGRYWTHKRKLVSSQLGRESRWYDIIHSLVERLSSDQTLSAPRTLLDPFDETEVAIIASHNVIVLDGGSVRFFHEAFFDYCFARLFAERGQTVLELLTKDGKEQHLFRRAQVRQVLEYERERNRERYIRNLRDLLTSERVRYHLKKLTVDWLGNISDPKEDEWSLLESLGTSSALGRSAVYIQWNRPAWVLLLMRLGVWARWLESPDREFSKMAVRMLALPDAMKICSKEIAQLFRPYVYGENEWREEFSHLFSFGEPHHSREMFDLFCEATRRKLVAALTDRDWYHYEKLAEEKPDYAVIWLSALLDLQSEEGDDDTEEEEKGIRSDFILEIARLAPEAYAREVLPRIVEALKNEVNADSKVVKLQFLLKRATPRSGDTLTALTRGLEIALGSLARESPKILDSIVVPAEGIPHDLLSALLLSAWGENGSHYANTIISYLTQDIERLGLKMFMWEDAGALAAVRVAVPYCSEELYANIESAIMGFTPSGEKGDPKRVGYQRMRLLECLPSERMSHGARMHFEELKRKFPWEKFNRSRDGVRSGWVTSPIPDDAILHMNDDHWLEAMRTYATERSRDTSDFLKGGKHELSRALGKQAQINKPRFAQLALSMGDTIAPEYFSAILSGITAASQPTAGEPELPPSALLSLEPEAILEVVYHVQSIASTECAKEICRAIRTIAEKHPPLEAIQIVCNYATRDPDPSEEEWQKMSGDAPLWGGDPHSHGMNSVRGVAAETLASFLFADEKYLEQIIPAVHSVVTDRSIAVRSCAMLCLVAMLNFDRDQAVELFLTLCSDADPVLGTYYSEQFIHHATFRHYESLRGILLRMLISADKDSRLIAGRQIVLAAFHDSSAGQDLERVLSGDEICRKAAAEIYAHNLGHAASRNECARRLKLLFHDPDQEVRSTASDCFRLISPDLLAQEKELMFCFIESPACLENSHELILALEESTEPLSEVICRIPERLIEEQRALREGESIENRRWTYHLPPLVARLYEQTHDNETRSRCLNIIDGMLELGFSEIDKELAQVER